jgi:transcription termination/antitermination protein NusG
MSDSENEKRWYVLHAYSGYERKVKLALEERIELSGMQAFFGDILVPTEEVLEMRGGQKRKSERKFFPGYVIIQMALNDESWHLVKNTPRVMGFIGGTAEKPAPITQREVDEIMNRLEETVDKPTHKIMYEPGEMVRIIDGPFNDFTGTVEEVNYDKSRVRVAVLILGRTTPVELGFAQVEKG